MSSYNDTENNTVNLLFFCVANLRQGDERGKRTEVKKTNAIKGMKTPGEHTSDGRSAGEA